MNTPFSKLTFAIAWASAELMLPIRKSTLSRSISLVAFCTAVAVSPLVESSTSNSTLTAKNATLGVDLFESELRADQFVLAERGESAGQRIVEADLDGSSASDFTTNGLATCMAPIARPAFSIVRRCTGQLTRSLDIAFSSCGVIGFLLKVRHLSQMAFPPLKQADMALYYEHDVKGNEKVSYTRAGISALSIT